MFQNISSLGFLVEKLEKELSQDAQGANGKSEYRPKTILNDLPLIRIEDKLMTLLIQREEQIIALRLQVQDGAKRVSALETETQELTRKVEDLTSQRNQLLLELANAQTELIDLRTTLRIHNTVPKLPGDVSGNSPTFARKAIQRCGNFQYNLAFNNDIPVVSKGPVQLEDGAIYLGEWNSENQRHGRGEQTWKDGSKYEGYWKCNKASGKGRKIYGNGDVYVGDWVDDKANGNGVFIYSDGRRIVGEWKNDKVDGFGVETWPDGARYEGCYCTGRKEGEGKFTWSDGSTYQGQLKDTKIHGIGTYTWPDGRKYVGGWKHNMMNGHGVHTWADGRKYEGDYLDDKRTGFGEFTWSDGRSYKGYWLAGKQHGKGTSWMKGKGRDGEWDRGTRVKWLSAGASDNSP